ncbi:hypothetical protein [Caudoviricetes sp.]|nr:hypothetical protein [Caudoviricetes sp.]
MAARIRKTHQDEIRAKIKTTALINRVQDYAIGNLADEDVSPNRLNAIKLLLSKSLPDLSSVQVTGDPDQPLAFTEIVRKIVK